MRRERDPEEFLRHMRNISPIGFHAKKFQRETGRRYKEGWKTLDGSPASTQPEPGRTAEEIMYGIPAPKPSRVGSGGVGDRLRGI